jgi:penicillin-binding protein 1C
MPRFLTKIIKRPRLFIAWGTTVFIAIMVVIFLVLPDYRNAIPEQQAAAGTVVVDCKGRLLRVFPDAEGRSMWWQELDRFPECLKRAAIAAEDKRFYVHPGFDPIAIMRALYINIREGRTISGASTITQQVVRLIRPRPRTYRSKVIELFAAVKMETQLSKAQILELYLNLSPMGGHMRGARLAARRYFDKDVDRVNVVEAAVLAALPRSPSRYDPRGPQGRRFLLEEKDRILHRMVDAGWVQPSELRVMLGPSVRFKLTRLPMNAPHFVDFAVNRRTCSVGPEAKTTLDLDIQKALEHIARSHRSRLAGMGVGQAGILVTSRSGNVLGMVGSLQYASQDEGFNNAVLAFRSAGSTLKPFLYALALERGYASASELPDTFRTYRTPQGDYLPLNADRRSYGPVSVRTALGNSLNISAVKVAQDVGLDNFCRLLEELDLVKKGSCSPDQYGLGIAIGNVEVSLYKLVQAYGALARQGRFSPSRSCPTDESTAIPVFSTEIAYVITHILSDHSSRLLTFGNPAWLDFGFPVAVKTGTSTQFRDSWAVGYTTEHVVGVWAGNFGGRSNNGYPGSTVCGPIFNDIIRTLYPGRPPTPFLRPDRVHEQVVCSMSGKRATSQCPHRTVDLFVGTLPTPLEACDLAHEPGIHHYLNASYAQWIDRRELMMGPGRFRLMKPEGSLSASSERPLILREPASGRSRAAIEIVNPHDEDRFVLSPFQPNRVLLRAVPYPVVEEVTWLVDGVEVAKSSPPYELIWELTRGTHRIVAVTPRSEAAQITIHVE